mgnify:CR=1 FL=1
MASERCENKARAALGDTNETSGPECTHEAAGPNRLLGLARLPELLATDDKDGPLVGGLETKVNAALAEV